MQYRGCRPNQVCTKYDSVLTLTYFRTMSNGVLTSVPTRGFSLNFAYK